MRHRRWLVAFLTAAVASNDGTATATAAAAAAASFTCPSANKAPAPHTLSMNCFGACPDPASPCLFYAGSAKCSGLEQQPQQFGAGTCVVGADAQCALECLAPFSGAGRDAWHLVLTDVGAGFAEDVAERRAREPAFGFVTRPVEWVQKITDLAFAPTTTQVYVCVCVGRICDEEEIRDN